jgi:multidrug resistance efflux pump
VTPQPKPQVRIATVATQPPDAALRTTAPDLTGTVAKLQSLLKVEHDARLATTLAELWFVLANDARRLLDARQIYVLDSRGCVRAVSSLAKVDRDSATIRWIERSAAELFRRAGDERVLVSSLPEFAAVDEATALHFPFGQFLHLTLKARDGRRFATAVAVRETSFSDAEKATAGRLALTFGHAAEALGGARQSGRMRRPMIAAIAGAAAAALMLIQVPMAVLAPAEVVARRPMVVAAPVDGVIDAVPVDIGKAVKAGDVVLRLSDTQARNQYEIAGQELAVAEARWRQISLAAFQDAAARRELAVAATEVTLKRAERNYAADLLSRMVVRADRDGIAVYADRRELIGRPVQTGQRILEIADPGDLIVRINAPVDDAMAMRPGARAKIFLDADPLNPVAARLTEAGLQARQTENGALAFRVDAEVDREAIGRLRIGHRGAAQILGDDVSLGFYLFRRPISWARQKVGL